MNSLTIAENYINKLRESLLNLDLVKIDNFVKVIEKKWKNNQKIYFCGNGGSLLNSTHFAMGLSIVSKKWKKPIRSFSFADSAILTSLANDYNFDETYSRLVEVYLEPNDLLIILSSSGNSSNLLSAAIKAKSLGVDTYAFLGNEGGKLKELVNDYLIVQTPIGDAGFAEDIHMIIGHIVTYYLEHMQESSGE